MKTQIKFLTIVLAIMALIAITMTTDTYAISGGRADRAGNRSGGAGREVGGSAAGEEGSDSASTDRSAQDTRDEGETLDNGEENATQERSRSRSRRGGFGGGRMGEVSLDDVTERALDRAESVLDNLDTNQDGAIDSSEIEAGTDERAQSLYDRLVDRYGETDVDEDGEVDGVAIDPDSRMADRLGDADVNGDGVVSADELGTSYSDHLNEYDADTDGEISADELSEGMVANATERFEERDTNGDGVLNRDDRETDDAETEAGEETDGGTEEETGEEPE